MRRTANVMRGALRDFNTITENASKTDKAGDWGLDAWVRVIHELVDLQVRTTAAVVQAAISGPWWTEPLDDEPEPSEPIPVDVRDYPRTLSAATPFVRIGSPETAIPARSIGFIPEKELPAGDTKFQVVLKDYRFVGANYKGTVRLTRADGTPAEPEDMDVTVGL
jgi:hypothetical protein